MPPRVTSVEQVLALIGKMRTAAGANARAMTGLAEEAWTERAIAMDDLLFEMGVDGDKEILPDTKQKVRWDYS